jgi:hypothetical protein
MGLYQKILVGFVCLIVLLFIIDSVKSDKTSSTTSIPPAPALSQTDIQQLGAIGDACRADLASSDWKSSKAGKICAKHADWSKCDCDKLATNKIWIGMEIEMVAYLRGNPNTKNVSNYGSGNSYQYCWNNYTPSCFYVGSDGIVESYN